MPPQRRFFVTAGAFACVALTTVWLGAPAAAQTAASLQGQVADESGSVIAGATVRAEDPATGFDAAATTDRGGRYTIPAMPPGIYRVTASAMGFATEVIEALHAEAGRTLVRGFGLKVGEQSETVVVRAETPLIDRASASVSYLVTPQTVREIPLNGRHFMDLAVLAPGSVSPSQLGFSSRPIRGTGTLAFNAAGSREEAAAYVVNGVSTNNLTFGSLIFEPPIAAIEAVKIDSPVISAELGHVSGAVVNIVTRSGTDDLHGELFEFFRNSALDARNFFEFTSSEPHPFQRNQFGGSFGGPIRRGRAFFFGAYEGLRQRQGLDLNSVVPSDAQRAGVVNPVILALLPLIPTANYFDADGTPRFVGSAPAVVDTDRLTIDIRHNMRSDRLAGFYGEQRVRGSEPTAQGNSIPGFGQVSHPFTSTLTIGDTHTYGPALLNEIRFGRTRLRGGSFPANTMNPADLGIADGVTQPIGLPQFVVAGGLNFGGPATLPQGRIDTSYVVGDTLSRDYGRQSMRMGGEYRHFVNDNFAEGTGSFNFPTMAAFLAGTANAFNTTLGRRTSVIDQRAAAIFFQDRAALANNITLELGLRWEWHVTPTERDNKFIVFDPARVALVQVGVDTPRIYRQNNLNLEPRVGVAWDVAGDGRSSLRASYGRTVDEPGTTAVRDTPGNPPFAAPLTAAGAIPLDAAVQTTRGAGLAPNTTDRNLTNAALDAWNVNLQRQVASEMAVTIGYRGSHGTHLRISRNINQPVNGVRPFPALSASSPILPGAALGNITQVESSGYSNYNALWTSVTKRLSHGLQLDGSYTWSKSLDTNSLNSSGFVVQDAYDIPNQYGPSDFDARHRVAVSAIYVFPFTNLLARDWQLSTVFQAQSGNPFTIVTSNASLNGTANTVRPDLVAPIRIIGSVDRWFDPASFEAVNRFGNLGRNALVGPGYSNTDVSVARSLPVGDGRALQFRVDVFDLFNHANLGPPGNIVGSPTFGKISRTRLPTGEAGSSRQIQLAGKLTF